MAITCTSKFTYNSVVLYQQVRSNALPLWDSVRVQFLSPNNARISSAHQHPLDRRKVCSNGLLPRNSGERLINFSFKVQTLSITRPIIQVCPDTTPPFLTALQSLGKSRVDCRRRTRCLQWQPEAINIHLDEPFVATRFRYSNSILIKSVSAPQAVARQSGFQTL